MSLALPEGSLPMLRSIFDRHPGIREVALFGSRALGRHRPNSDIDLAYWGELDLAEHAHLFDELDQLPLPHSFDLVAYADIDHLPFREHIDRVGILIYRKS